VERTPAADYQPPLTWWGHAWRLLAMLATSALVWGPVVSRQSELQWMLDVAGGVVAYALVSWRRRRPVGVAVATALLGAFSGIAAGPAVLASASVATHRRWKQLAVVGSVNFATAQFFASWQPSSSDESAWLTLGANAVATSAILAWGMYIGSRRELLWTLRQRADRAEAEQELRAAQARTTERSRIAREMHDVLAHRISQVAMHAGALGFREDLSAEELREGVRTIQQRAHEALTDLRGVLGVLRDEAGEPQTAPQPTYADLPALVGDARAAGLTVSLVDELAEPHGRAVPDAAGRAVYRIVQEGLTNAHKHAPGATVRIRISGGPEQGLELHLDNPLGFGSGTPGAGLGLVGLSERAELLGGRLEHRREHGSFVVDTWIPWAAA
jgi:signal transduction histidine kinase